jgi:hypothetical protein
MPVRITAGRDRRVPVVFLACYTNNFQEGLTNCGVSISGNRERGLIRDQTRYVFAGDPCNGEELSVESGLPLGLVPNATYNETALQMLGRAQLTLITDGVVEARSKDGELFRFDRSKAISLESAERIGRRRSPRRG